MKRLLCNEQNGQLPEGNARDAHLNVQDLDHHIHEVVGQPIQFDATISPPHYSRIGQISPEPHWQNHQTELPRVPENLGSPSNNLIQNPKLQTLKESWISAKVDY